MNYNVLRFDSIDSTNLEASRQARGGAGEGTCVVARQQTDGRGRLGRKWASPADAGLYLSIVLRPKLDLASLPLISLAAAIAVYDTLADLGMFPDIKWPNDIMINDRKISGILAETTESRQGLVVVLGIGINLTSQSFPAEIADTATSIENESKAIVEPVLIESKLLNEIAGRYTELAGIDGPREIVAKWSARSSYVRGMNVVVTLPDETLTGITDGLEMNGALRIRTIAGPLRIIHAGDVQRLRPSDRN